jgi:hypothetical protein
MGAILDLIPLMMTPVGIVVTIAVLASIFFFVRWVMKD